MSKLSQALLELQKDAINAKKSAKATVPTKNGGNYSYEYSTLEDVWEAARDRLTKLGLVAVHGIENNEVYTKVFHSEEPKEDELVASIPIVGATDMQKLGSAITYARRYGLVTTLGVLTGDDDDGAMASQPPFEGNVTSQPPSDKQVNFVETLLKNRDVPSDVEAKVREKLTDHAFNKTSIKTVIDNLQKYPEKS